MQAIFRVLKTGKVNIRKPQLPLKSLKFQSHLQQHVAYESSMSPTNEYGTMKSQDSFPKERIRERTTYRAGPRTRTEGLPGAHRCTDLWLGVRPRSQD